MESKSLYLLVSVSLKATGSHGMLVLKGSPTALPSISDWLFASVGNVNTQLASEKPDSGKGNATLEIY